MTTQDESASPPTVEPTPGQRLRAAREALDLGTAEVAAKLKLSVRQVEAIEADDWSALPERPFARGFYRNYARLVSIDPDSLGLDAPTDKGPAVGAPGTLDAGTQLESHAATSEPLHTSGRRRSPWLIPITLAVILIAGAVYLHQSGTTSSVRPQTVWPTPTPPVAPSTTAAPATGTPPTSATATVPAAPPASATGAASTSVLAGATDSTAPASAAAPAPSTTASPAANPTPPSEGQNVLGTAKPREGESVVRITFSGRSWTEVRSKGEVVFSETAAPGTREFTAARPLSFIIGNASAVKLEIDGKPHDFAPSTRSDVARFQVP